MKLIECTNLNLGYDNKAVVTNLSFFVNLGDFLCVVGENGSGKTTLIKALTNLNPPISGSITLGAGLKKNEIGYLPQQTAAQKDFPATVMEVVLTGNLNKKKTPFYTKKDKREALENMELLGVLELKDKCYRELSGGQQQRVLLARALTATSKILLLDEPTAALDPKATAEFYELISSLNKEGVTVIMVSHDIEAAQKYANTVLHIGNPFFFGKASDYFNEGGRNNA